MKKHSLAPRKPSIEIGPMPGSVQAFERRSTST